MKKSFWDRFAKLYNFAESFNAKAYQGMIRVITECVPDGSDILECAAGTGILSAALAPKAKHVLCTDYSLPMLAEAKTRAERLQLRNLDFAQRDIFHLEDSDNSYDVVIAANVLHLLDTPQDAIRELWRVTKPGGMLILPTFLLGEADFGFRQVIRLYKLLGFDSKRNYTRHSYQKMVDGCGLGKAHYTLVRGRLPVGLAILKKP